VDSTGRKAIGRTVTKVRLSSVDDFRLAKRMNRQSWTAVEVTLDNFRIAIFLWCFRLETSDSVVSSGMEFAGPAIFL